jgi:colanic acid biosynthesis glycosyl transferase WcaI
LIIDAAKILEKIEKILFLFSGEGSSKKSLQKSAQGLQNIFFGPLQPTVKLNQLLNVADVHVLPQRPGAADAVLPSKLTGMLASGKPVIATSLLGTEITLELSEAVRIIPPDDPEALANEIEYLYYNPKSREKYGSLGRAFAQNHWSKEEILKGVLVKFQQLSKNPA